ncbi:MAG: sporulation transcription factor Spo0A [Clostridiales bacterium]|nr:sporulation transcription factor Spo0A [Clostridiales bacterium]
MEKNKNIKIMLIDENEQTLKLLKENFSSDGFEVVGAKSNGIIALEEIKKEKPDVIIMDVVLSGVDGFSLIESINTLNIETKIIVVSSLSLEGFITKALNLGVSYYMIKPFNMEVLKSRVLDVLNDNKPKANIQVIGKNRNLEEKITNIFITVGIPAHIKGYQFLREAIKMAIDNPDIINSITKKLYPSIAEKFETSASKVERAIRHAIEVAWNRGKIENINTLFGIKVYANNEKPTNGEFIALVADKMLLEGV